MPQVSVPGVTDVFKHHMISTAPDYLPFGTGKHACPGRFFAATELKMMLAHFVVNYDLEAESGATPADKFGPASANASATGKARIRRRV
ncbi:hypothetical protein C8F01DRAFT_1264742 [Mycena amicta]|nr:hypothetical protein C8F01DRAFT_1264742 [Mycena amicta]